MVGAGNTEARAAYHISVDAVAVSYCTAEQAHLVAWLAGIRAAVAVQRAVVVQDVDELQVVALACGEILRVVRRRDLRAAGAEVSSFLTLHRNFTSPVSSTWCSSL